MALRGRGRHSSLTQEQLQALGCVGKDLPSVPTAPPPAYPSLLSKPVPLETSAAQNYKILWKEDFLNHMRDSPYYMAPQTLSNKIQRYTDQYLTVLENSKAKCKAEIPWQLMPFELKPNFKRKNQNAQPNLKKKKLETIEQRLKVLEEKEKGGNVDIGVKEQPASDSDNEDKEEEVEVEEDDEMDDENDYGNNYFDNGEAFNEEDDNLDDGPIY